MISISPGGTLLLYTQPADMRKSFDGLSGIVRSELGREPDDGSLFLFINRRRDRIKVLYWDGDGFALWYKRLESGTLEMVASVDGQPAVTIDAAQLAMLLSGVPLSRVKRRKRHVRA